MVKTPLKYDAGKPPLSMIPVEAEETCARAFAYGARKYSRGNFRVGPMAHSRLLDAAKRHCSAIGNGQLIDPDSGVEHVGLALASLSMLAFQQRWYPEANDLYPTVVKAPRASAKKKRSKR